MKKIVSVLTVFALLFSVFASFATVSVGATGDPDNLINKPVYYITDSIFTFETYHDLISDMDGVDFEFYHASSQVAFWEEMAIWESGEMLGLSEVGSGVIPCYEDIENAIVFFEVDQGFPLYNTLTFPIDCFDILSTLFAELKENGCYILFKCATDESRFEVNADFLNYVDFHINTDIMTVFAHSVFADIENRFGDICNITFLMNNQCLNANTYTDPNTWTFFNYLSSYLRQRYMNEFGAWVPVRQIMAAKNIQILNQDEETIFYDVVTYQEWDITSSDFSSNYESDNYVVAIGAFTSVNVSSTSEGQAQSFVSAINAFQADRTNYPLYIFNPLNITYTNTNSQATYTMGETLSYCLNQIPHIITAFIENADCSGSADEGTISILQYALYPYHNWPSQCLFCYKPIDLTLCTWAHSPCGGENELLWGIIQTPENDLRAYSIYDHLQYVPT